MTLHRLTVHVWRLVLITALCTAIGRLNPDLPFWLAFPAALTLALAAETLFCRR